MLLRKMKELVCCMTVLYVYDLLLIYTQFRYSLAWINTGPSLSNSYFYRCHRQQVLQFQNLISEIISTKRQSCMNCKWEESDTHIIPWLTLFYVSQEAGDVRIKWSTWEWESAEHANDTPSARFHYIRSSTSLWRGDKRSWEMMWKKMCKKNIQRKV